MSAYCYRYLAEPPPPPLASLATALALHTELHGDITQTPHARTTSYSRLLMYKLTEASVGGLEL